MAPGTEPYQREKEEVPHSTGIKVPFCPTLYEHKHESNRQGFGTLLRIASQPKLMFDCRGMTTIFRAALLSGTNLFPPC
jgi:hypothetical protein